MPRPLARSPGAPHSAQRAVAEVLGYAGGRQGPSVAGVAAELHREVVKLTWRLGVVGRGWGGWVWLGRLRPVLLGFGWLWLG